MLAPLIPTGRVRPLLLHTHAVDDEGRATTIHVFGRNDPRGYVVHLTDAATGERKGYFGKIFNKWWP